MLQWRLMTDDALIAGAAAPTRTRRIASGARLDVVWILVTSAALVISSVFDLIDLPTQRLRTGDAPLRVFVIGLPLVACVLAGVAARRRSELVAAAATGVLGPGIALAGSLSVSLFLDDDSAFADVGVAVSLVAALLGTVMLVRWFVYHPLSLLVDERRPLRALSYGAAAVGLVLVAVVVLTGIDDGLGAAWFGQTAALLTVPAVVVGGSLVRTVPSAVLVGSAAVTQIVAVLVVKLERSAVALDSDLTLRTGVVGLLGLGATVALAAGAVVRSAPDDAPSQIDDDESWRWSSDD